MSSLISFLHVYLADASTIIKKSATDACDTNCGNSSLGTLFGQASNALIYLVGAISVVMIILGGFKYVVSGGDPKAISAAKDTILYSVIGLVVAILSYALVNFVIGKF